MSHPSTTRAPTSGGVRPRQLDMLLSAGVLAIQMAGTHATLLHHHSSGSHAWWAAGISHLDAAAYTLLGLGPLALLVRRRYPRAVLAFVFGVTLAYAARGYPAGPVFLSLIIAFGTVVIAGDRWFAVGSIVVGWPLFLWLPAAFGTGTYPTVGVAAGLAAWLLVLLFAAEVMRSRRERLAAVRREREQEGLRRVEEERLRIARELHDVLAHNISLINVQSGVALHLLDERPEQARTALATINDASADALREIRSVLGVLRHVDEHAPRQPAASLDRLPDLVARSAETGLEVAVHVAGQRRPLPSDVDLAAYRIVQESLTNVSRHAHTESATVSIHYNEESVTLEVSNENESRPGANIDLTGDGSGNGIRGMRERAVALGGDLEAGSRPGGGFRVRARLPLNDWQ